MEARLRNTVKYARGGRFQRELRRRVHGYFTDRGLSPRGGARMLFKSLAILAWFVGSWVALVFFTDHWWQAVPLTIALALSIAAIGFAIQHDAGHGAFSHRRWVNRLAAFMLDVTGGSSYMWKIKHGELHHHYTNIAEVDDDIDARPFLRMAATQKWRWYHRYQHVYAWFLYAFLPPKWLVVDDFRALIRGRIGQESVPRPRNFELVFLFIGKAIFFSWALVIPLLMGHHILAIVGLYAVAAWVLGITLATIFQLAHCQEDRLFEAATPSGPNRISRSWSEHQLATTADFAPGSRMLTWFVGGLNYQVIHHLFPLVSHVHDPKLAPIVDEVCAQYGLERKSYPTLAAAISSHARFMHTMGQPPLRSAAVVVHPQPEDDHGRQARPELPRLGLFEPESALRQLHTEEVA